MNRLFLILLCLIGFGCREQNKNRFFKLETNVTSGRNFISCIDGKDFYRLNISDSSVVKLMIKELLQFKGNTSISHYEVNFKPHRLAKSFFYKSKNVSIQLEALSKIDYLIFGNNDRSPIIIIIDDKNKEYSITGEGIIRAYSCYIKWFKLVQEKGLNYVLSKGIYPLNECKVKWL